MDPNPYYSRHSEPNPYLSPHSEDTGRWPPWSRSGWRLKPAQLLGVAGVIGLLVFMLMPATRSASSSARRSACLNNVKQIALALQDYRAEHGALPPACTVDANGHRLHSWRTLILPYLGEQALYDSIDLTKPWNHPANAKACENGLEVFQCPAFFSGPINLTNYMAVVTPESCFRAGEPRSMGEITDDLANTVMVMEVDFDHAVPWMSPNDADEILILSLGPGSKLPHRDAIHAVFVDGSVRPVSSDAPAEDRQALISIAGGD